MQFFTGLESHSLARGDGDLSSRARVASNAGLSWPDVENSEASKFDPVSTSQGLLQALKYRVHGGLSLVPRQTGLLDHVMNNVLFNQRFRPEVGSMPR